MKIAVLGANYQYLHFYKQAKDLEYEIIAFGRASDDHIAAQKYADKFFDISFREKEKILEICKEEKVDGVTSFLIESAVPFVYYISRGLGIPCNSRECEKLMSTKFSMREQFKKEGVSSPDYRLVKYGENLPVGLNFPIIVKPTDSGGSRGVTKVDSYEQLSDAFKRAFEYSSEGAAILEQYVGGREFSIEAISYKGVHYILQITDKETTGAPYFVELAHHQPADLNKDQWASISNLTLKALDALKIEYGASHTEIKMENDGKTYIIETSPRMGGGYITSDLVRLSTGYDFVKGVLEIATGKFTKPNLKKEKYAGVYFLSKETQHKVSPIIKNKDKLPYVVDADIYGKLQSLKCNSDRAGYFIYQSNKKIVL